VREAERETEHEAGHEVGREGRHDEATRVDVAIVGAGLAGLACALHLTGTGRSCRVFEASDGVGGRIRTDRRDGFLLDRGFQVFLTGYPEARRVLDLEGLDLRPFEPGALVRVGAGFYPLLDPFRHPLRALSTLRSPVGGVTDKLRVLKLRHRARSGELFEGPETTVVEALRGLGFSDRMIDAFFRPFLGGVFLEPALRTSSYMLDFVVRWMSRGEVALPARGMGSIPGQLAGRLPPGTVRLASPVRTVEAASGARPAAAILDGGARVEARAVVIATDGPEAARLLGPGRGGATAHEIPEEIPDLESRSVVCFYFAADEPPIEGPWLLVSGEREDLVRNFAVLSQVAPSYAPPDRHLVMATVLGGGARGVGPDDAELETAVHRQLTDWFGNQVDLWERLGVYRIPHALPAQLPGFRARRELGPQVGDGLYVAGDWLENASIEGALLSGRRAAEAVLAAAPRASAT
jgi:protoporphyrinogen oxidase